MKSRTTAKIGLISTPEGKGMDTGGQCPLSSEIRGFSARVVGMNDSLQKLANALEI